jgi:tRNA pseudouridine38-40 synthase
MNNNICFYLVTIAYDGSNFGGWAKQPNNFTVQGCIENIISKIFKRSINILAAGRTDKGVHACNQKFILRLSWLFAKKKLLNLLKKTLGEYILVKKIEKVDSNFHPIHRVINKEYRYFINVGKYNIFQKKYRWEYNLPLETDKLNEILKIFRGQHNFFNYSYYRRSEREKVNTVRQITSIKCWKRKNIIIISIIGKSFLRYQIRTMIGEVIDCYEGKKTKEDLKNKLENPDLSNYQPKRIAPPCGLYLWTIKY